MKELEISAKEAQENSRRVRVVKTDIDSRLPDGKNLDGYLDQIVSEIRTTSKSTNEDNHSVKIALDFNGADKECQDECIILIDEYFHSLNFNVVVGPYMITDTYEVKADEIFISW